MKKETLEKIIENCKNYQDVLKTKTFIKEFLSNEHKENFYKLQKVEYNLLFPIFRELTTSEKASYDIKIFTNLEKPENFEYPKIKIDYSKDENFLTYEQYRDETIIVTPAEDAQIAEDGTIITQVIEEIRELKRPYILSDLALDYTVNSYPHLITKQKELKKQLRDNTLDNLTIEIQGGLVFDADENSLSKMEKAINMMDRYNRKNPTEQILQVEWKMADNTIQNITYFQLENAVIHGNIKFQSTFIQIEKGE